MLEALEQRWKELLKPGSSGLVGFSGGPDSLALLDLLRRSPLGLSLRAVHIHHGLRAEADAEAAHAETLARAMAVPFQLIRVDCSGPGNLQSRARDARRRALAQCAADHDADWIALAHHAEDQAETLLMRLIRGSGITGLAAMKASEGIWRRPLLHTSRSELETYLADRGLQANWDPSNGDRRFFRTRVRQDLMPILQRENPRITEGLGRTAAQLGAESEALDQLLKQHLDTPQQAGAIELGPVRALPEALRARALRLLLGGIARTWESRHFAALVALISDRSGTRSIDLPGGSAQRVYDQLVWLPAEVSQSGAVPAAPVFQPIEITGPGRFAGPGGTVVVEQRAARGASDELCASRLQFPWNLRPWRSSDRIRIGPDQHKRVSRLLIDQKVPKVNRHQALVVECDEALALVLGIRRAFGWAPEPGAPALTVRCL